MIHKFVETFNIGLEQNLRNLKKVKNKYRHFNQRIAFLDFMQINVEKCSDCDDALKSLRA